MKTDKITPERKAEWLAWLRQGPDAVGPCERCDRDKPTWELPAAIEPLRLMYCRECFRREIEKS